MAENWQIQSRDGTRLAYRLWKTESPRAVLAIVPGYADHAGRYEHVGAFLNEAGIEAWALDLRGHGRSGGARGYVDRFDQYLDDLDALLSETKTDRKGAPVFVLGHSMGGLVALTYALRRGGLENGFAVSSPFLGVAMKVPRIKIVLGKIMSRIYPRLALPSGINPADLSSDPAVSAAYARDPLVFKTATARWFTEAMSAIESLKRDAAKITQPCLFMQAGEDRLADPKVSKPLFETLGSKNKTYIEYPGFYHEIFNEREKGKPLSDLRDWIVQKLK